MRELAAGRLERHKPNWMRHVQLPGWNTVQCSGQPGPLGNVSIASRSANEMGPLIAHAIPYVYVRFVPVLMNLTQVCRRVLRGRKHRGRRQRVFHRECRNVSSLSWQGLCSGVGAGHDPANALREYASEQDPFRNINLPLASLY